MVLKIKLKVLLFAYFSFLSLSLSFFSSSSFAKNLTIHVPQSNINVLISDQGEIMRSSKHKKENILAELPKSYFTIAYSVSEKIPRLTALVLGYDGVIESDRRKKSFSYDVEAGKILGQDESIHDSDFKTNKPLNRGHLVPSQYFFKRTKSFSTFVVTNVAPQYISCNDGPWNKVENEILSHVTSDHENKYLVLTGTLVRENAGSIEIKRRIKQKLKNVKPMKIPSHFFSAVLKLKPIGEAKDQYRLDIADDLSNIDIYVVENRDYTAEEKKSFLPSDVKLPKEKVEAFLFKLGIDFIETTRDSNQQVPALEALHVSVKVEAH
jgi:DNA/RNA endonuclease G (NUC1)